MSVRLERLGAIARITLERPEALNALNGEMKDRIGDLALELQRDAEVRCVVLCGQGRAFCAGSDIGTMTGFDVRAGRARLQQAHRLILGIANLDKPVIAAVRGAAVGVGFSLALASDLIVASQTARFGLVFKKVGLAPDGGMAYFLTQAIGARRATRRPPGASESATLRTANIAISVLFQGANVPTVQRKRAAAFVSK